MQQSKMSDIFISKNALLRGGGTQMGLVTLLEYTNGGELHPSVLFRSVPASPEEKVS